MDYIPQGVVDDLIALGSLGDTVDQPELSRRLRPHQRVNCMGWDPWNLVCQGLSEADLSFLIKGLTLAESDLKWPGGSVAAVIWVYRQYENRFPQTADAIADWVLKNSENPYVPFGRMRSGCKSLEAYRGYLVSKARRHKESLQEQENQVRHKKIREQVRKRLSEESRLLQKAHAAARQQLLVELGELSAKERLEHLAWDDFHSLAFYPANFAQVTNEDIDQLDSGTRQQLLEKLAVRHKGVWKRLYDRLVKT